MQSISAFLDITKIAKYRSKNADVERTQGLCHVIYMLFGSSLRKVCYYNYRICVTDFRDAWGLFASPPSVRSPKKAHSKKG